MSEKTKARYSRLDLDKRLTIQKGITEEKNWTEIAQEIGVDPTTVSREVLRHRIRDRSLRYGEGKHRFCANERNCTVKGLCAGCSTRLCRVCKKVLCTRPCPHYLAASCKRLVGAPYVCNGCSRKRGCFVERWVYDARSADVQARLSLVSAREGIDLEVDEAKEIEVWLGPLIKAGQTPEEIYLTHKDELSFSIRSLYTYIAAGVFPSLSNFDLQRKVRYKKRTKKATAVPRDFTGRSYHDFCELDASLRAHTTELDTVIGRRGGACFMTMYLRSCQLMPIFLLAACTQEAVQWAFNEIDTALLIAELKFSDIFPLLLGDRGSELSNFDAIEELGKYDAGALHKSHVYYCDPRRPDQKGALEGSHTYIREVLPKGVSFDTLEDEDVHKLASHINSIPRPSLGGRSPYEVACFLYGKLFVENLGITYIAPDEVIRRPWLLEK